MYIKCENIYLASHFLYYPENIRSKNIFLTYFNHHGKVWFIIGDEEFRDVSNCKILLWGLNQNLYNEGKWMMIQMTWTKRKYWKLLLITPHLIFWPKSFLWHEPSQTWVGSLLPNKVFCSDNPGFHIVTHLINWLFFRFHLVGGKTVLQTQNNWASSLTANTFRALARPAQAPARLTRHLWQHFDKSMKPGWNLSHRFRVRNFS